MTFSIVARSVTAAAVEPDEVAGEAAGGASDPVRAWGVAVASKFLAVGAAVPAARAGAGAVATQSYANLSYRADGLALLAGGTGAQATLDRLVGADDLRDLRQVGVVDATGGSATYTGNACHEWAGGRTGPDVAVQGNILVGPQVLDAMLAAWESSDPAMPLARRLLAALRAGDNAGGDRRGRQSAALLVVSEGGGYGGSGDVAVDLRVDDHPKPVAELARLLDLHDLYFSRADLTRLLPLEGEVLAEVAGLLTLLGFPPTSGDVEAVRAALWEWAGVENLEERIAAEHAIDPVVLDALRAKAGA